jgi:hypothetical protein
MSLTDEQLRRRLASVPVDADVDVDVDLSLVRTRTRHRRRRGRVIAATLVLVVGVALAGVATALARDESQRSSIVARPAPKPRPTATTLVPPGLERVPRSAITSYAAPENSGATIALGDGSVWVGGWPSDLGGCHVDCGRITRINAKTGEVMATITVPKLPRALVFEFGYLWAEVEMPDGSPAIIVRISPAKNAVEGQSELVGTSVAGSTGHPRLAAGAGYVWSLSGTRLDQLDRATGALMETTTLAVSADRILSNGGEVWLVENGERTGVSELDPANMGITQMVSLPGGFVQSAGIDGSTIWLTEAHGSGPTIELIRVDTSTGGVTFTGVATTNVAAGGGRVFFQGFAGAKLSTTHPGWVVQVAPSDGQPMRAARIDDAGITPPVLAVDPMNLWVLGGGRLWRVHT